MEEPYNGPGKPTHHRADGTNYVMQTGNEYHNIWPVYDWQKISGATIVQKPALYPPNEIQKDGLTDFVGAVTDGLLGAVAFDFISPHDFVHAKKAWFFFDGAYVCLGSGIYCNQRLPVATTVNQCLLRSEVTVSQDGKAEVLPEGHRELEQVNWVHHDRVGYIFPDSATVNVSNQMQSGRWSDITDEKNISDALVQEKVFLLWFNHGERPDKASYQYIVVPNVTAAQLRENARHEVEILANTPDIQGVKHVKSGICQLAFYKAGEMDISKETKVKSDSQGMVMIQMRENRIAKMTVADPSRKLSRMNLTISGLYHAKGDHFFTMSDERQNNTLWLIDLPQGVYAGTSVTVAL